MMEALHLIFIAFCAIVIAGCFISLSRIYEEYLERKRVEKWRKKYEWITEPLRDEETKE